MCSFSKKQFSYITWPIKIPTNLFKQIYLNTKFLEIHLGSGNETLNLSRAVQEASLNANIINHYIVLSLVSPEASKL